MDTVVLKFYIDGFGVSGEFEEDTLIPFDEWASMSEDEREEEARSLYVDHVTWVWREND